MKWSLALQKTLAKNGAAGLQQPEKCRSSRKNACSPRPTDFDRRLKKYATGLYSKLRINRPSFRKPESWLLANMMNEG